MSATTVESKHAARAVSPAAAWTPAAAAAAAALGLGGLFWMAAELIHFGGSGPDSMQWTAAHPTLSGVAISLDLLGTALLVFALPIWLLLGRPGSPRLAWAGAIAGVFGMAAQAVFHGVEIAGSALCTPASAAPAMLLHDRDLVVALRGSCISRSVGVSGPRCKAPMYGGIHGWEMGEMSPLGKTTARGPDPRPPLIQSPRRSPFRGGCHDGLHRRPRPLPDRRVRRSGARGRA